ncbi:MAG: single-stranded-DNA-specific exonuclease RecJ [Lachnospiraceae bacterium]|nr:single-stranded-DNA-specific exonuclease RecJ [Lachnospiraceae bacterium]
MESSVWTVSNIKGDFDALSKKYQITPMLARIMVNRGITSDADIRAYLFGTLGELHDPFLLKDMDRAVELLYRAVTDKSRIFIVGDYDIDGVCASYILKKGLSACFKACGNETDGLHNIDQGEDVSGEDVPDRIRVRLPDRQKDGYGMNRTMVDEAAEYGASVILTCDNGIAAFEEIKYAKEKGMTVIVTDHHEVPYEERDGEKQYLMPPADAVVDPKRPDCSSPFKGICGGVVAYKLISCLLQKFETEGDILKELLVFAAVATVGDIMELKDENRIIVKHGIAGMAASPNKGLTALINANGLDKNRITPYHIGYVLGPCINATGRLDLADRAFRLFDTEDEKEAAVTAAELKELNDSRKEMQQYYTGKAESMIEDDPSYDKDSVLVVFLPDCHESLAGLIAGKLKERYYKPSFVLTRGTECVKGSGRSIEAYDMFAEMTRVKELFLKFGGHKMAAGLSIEEKNVPVLRRKLNENASLTPEDMVKKLRADMQLHLNGASLDFAKELEKLEPYGNGNPKPLFVERDLRIVKKQVLGKNRNVLKLSVAPLTAFSDGKLSDWGAVRDAVIYGEADRISEELAGKERVLLMYELSVNVYMGNENVQLVVKDYKY